MGWMDGWVMDGWDKMANIEAGGDGNGKCKFWRRCGHGMG